MAKNFGNAGSAKKIKEVAKVSNEKANIIQVKMISNENLKDYPKNNEDITDTVDLENSMKELGFTDPIEVTSFGMKDGKYMIVSGHRRRRAGVKVGITTFPCIIKSFTDEKELRNYVLLANSQRDSAKDPLLFCKRYKMHEEYLKESGFKGKKREEIAKRLGISVQQADRYKKFNDVIISVWGMVTDGIVGMSSVLPMATHSIEEQNEIYNLLKEHNENGNNLSREVCSKIIKGYREGKRTLKEIFTENKEESINNQPVLGTVVNTENKEPKEEISNGLERNNEVNYDFSHREGLENSNDEYREERMNEDDKKVIELFEKQEEKKKNSEEEKKEKKVLTEEERQLQVGEKINSALNRVETLFNEFYQFENSEKAEITTRTMASMIKLMLNEMESISKKYNIEGKFKDIVNDIKDELLNEYCK